METIVEKYDDTHQDSSVLLKAGEILKSGGLVAIPTETVYGLGGDALNPQASAKIYAAKGRPSDNPLIVHIADVRDLHVLASKVSEKAEILAEKFWPGPLTMILPKAEIVPYATTGGLNTVAVRMPSHPTAMALIRDSGVYVAAPSANLSGRPSPTTAEHVYEDLNGRIEMIIDSGKTEIGLESSIIDLTGEVPMILRPGAITKAMFEEAIGTVEIDPAIMEDILPEVSVSSQKSDVNKYEQNSVGNAKNGEKSDGTNVDKDVCMQGLHPKAPGMKYKHYAPKGELVIVEGEPQKVADFVNTMIVKHQEAGMKTGVIASEENGHLYESPCTMNIGSTSHEESIAANLYDVLRKMDELGIERIYSESFAGSGLGTAIMNRLLKAAGHHIVRV